MSPPPCRLNQIMITYLQEVVRIQHCHISRGGCSVLSWEGSLKNCTPLPKASKPEWANQLTSFSV